MGLNKNIKVIIFDFDGTIFNLNIDWEGLRHDLDINETDLRLGEAINKYHRERNDKLDIVTSKELEAVGERGIDEATRDVFKSLLSGSYKLAIFSRNSSKTIKKVLENSHLDDNIYVVGREDVHKLKPNSEGLQIILKHYDIKPDEGVLIGDTYHDVVAGHEVGMKVVIVDNPNNQYRPENADQYVSNLTYLTSKLKAEVI